MNLRRATATDLKAYFELANDPLVRSNAINKQRIVWEQHCVWFEKKVNSEDAVLLVLESDNQLLGQIRFDREAPNEFVIDYAVDPALRGKGLGFQLLNMGVNYLSDLVGTVNVVGIVQLKNIASMHVFEKAGFTLDQSLVIDGQSYNKYCKTLNHE